MSSNEPYATSGAAMVENRARDAARTGTGRRGKKTAGAGKGKQKLIQSTQKATPKAIWIKRGAVEINEEQKAGKKPKVAELEVLQEKNAEEEKKVEGEGQIEGAGAQQEAEVADEEKAELGEDRLRPAK